MVIGLILETPKGHKRKRLLVRYEETGYYGYSKKKSYYTMYGTIMKVTLLSSDKPILSMLCKWQEQPMYMSAFSIVGPDIGGFVPLPNGELYAQWIQLVLFHPFCGTHSSGDHRDHEP